MVAIPGEENNVCFISSIKYFHFQFSNYLFNFTSSLLNMGYNLHNNSIYPKYVAHIFYNIRSWNDRALLSPNKVQGTNPHAIGFMPARVQPCPPKSDFWLSLLSIECLSEHKIPLTLFRTNPTWLLPSICHCQPFPHLNPSLAYSDNKLWVLLSFWSFLLRLFSSVP